LIATASERSPARIWQVADGTRVANLEGHTGHVLSVAWRADGLTLATGGADRSVRLWDVATRKQIKITNNFRGEIAAVSFVGTGDLLLAASSEQTLRLGDQPLPEATGFPFCATSDRAGRFIAAGAHDGVLRYGASPTENSSALTRNSD
jgi:WD40 repeat protein